MDEIKRYVMVDMNPPELKLDYSRIWEGVFCSQYHFCHDISRAISLADQAVREFHQYLEEKKTK